MILRYLLNHSFESFIHSVNHTKLLTTSNMLIFGAGLILPTPFHSKKIFDTKSVDLRPIFLSNVKCDVENTMFSLI